MEKRETKQKINDWSDHFIGDIIQDFRYLHQHPELSFHEENTAAYITDQLSSMHIPFRDKIGGFGILARIEGKNPQSKIIALRADMDALPIEEKTELPYRSVNPGVMHACGHDAHVACLLGAARILDQMRDEIEGTVLLVFQPGEEKHPGGARLMLEDGVFGEYRPQLMIAQHVNMNVPTGKVAMWSGCVMASADEFHIEVKGKGGHGAFPHLINDTVLAASQVVVSLQQLVSRRSNPFFPAVLTIGRFVANGATNIIPDSVFLSGTLRCMNESERKILKEHIRNTTEMTLKAYGCTCELDIYDGYPMVSNDEHVTLQATSHLEYLLGKDAVLPMERRMTAEDFGFFSAEIPSTFYRLGICGEINGDAGDQHTSTFRVDERALKTGVETFSFLAMSFLQPE